METKIDHTRAQTRHPDGVSSIVETLNTRLTKAGKPSVAPTDVEWLYSWAVGIGGGGGTALDNIYPSLLGKLDKRSAIHPFCPPGIGKPIPRADLPVEIVKLYTKPKVVVDPATTAHACSFSLVTNKGTQACLAVDGYRTKKSQYIRYKTIGDEDQSFMVLLEIDGLNATWSGGLVRVAEKRLLAAAPGAVFRYRNKPLTRLTAQEISALVGGKTLTLLFA
jgi:hypothetical protein